MAGKREVQVATGAVKRRLNKSIPTPDVETGRNPKVNPFLQEGAEKPKGPEIPRYVPTDWDDSLPYGGKVYLARRKKPESLPCLIFQGSVVVFALFMMYYGWYYTEDVQFHVTKLYAKMGHKDAQAFIGHKLLHGLGMEKNHTEAMIWLHEAAKQGHPHASYNVAVGHLQGIKTGLQPGEAYKLIRHAAENGIVEAAEVMEKVCARGRCDI